MEAIAPDALVGKPTGKGKALCDFRLRAMKRGIEAGHLRHVGQVSPHRIDAFEIVGLVEGARGISSRRRASVASSSTMGFA